MEQTNLRIAEYKNIGALNLLKFVLAFLTFLFHWRMHFGVVYSVRIIDKFINAGAVCMTGFFILSGFLLYYIYSAKDFSDIYYLKQFYLKRLIKILPMYFIVQMIYYIFCSSADVPFVIYVMQIIPLQGFFPDLFGVYLNGGLWFVSALLFLYFLFPLLCKLIKSIKDDFCLFIFLYFLAVFPSIVQCYYSEYNLGLYSMPVFRIPEFAIGMLSAKFFLSHSDKKRKNVYLAIFSVLLIVLSVGGMFSNKFFNGEYFRSHYMFYNVFLVILFPVLIYYLSTAKGKLYEAFTNNKVVNYLGKIAYGFFLGQIFCIYVCYHYFKPHNYFNLNGISILLVFFCMNIILAVFLYEVFEKRFSSFLQNLFIDK